MDVISRWGHWSYLLLLLGAALESATFLGLLVPGESLVLASGFLAARGVFAIGDLIMVVALGAILGDSVGYEFGHRLGRPWLLRAGRWVGLHAAHLDRSEAVFARYGGPTVLFGRFIGFLRALTPLIAGAARMPYRHFLLYNMLGGALWAMGCVARLRAGGELAGSRAVARPGEPAGERCTRAAGGSSLALAAARPLGTAPLDWGTVRHA
jgi:membrane protein DedA with SNARE-associated domain